MAEVRGLRRQMRQSGQERSEYFRRYHQAPWTDGALYDLTLNTGGMRTGTTADTAVHIAGCRRDR